MRKLHMLFFWLITVSETLAQTPTRTQVYVRAGIGASRAVGEKTSLGGSVLYNDFSSVKSVEAIPNQVGGSQWLFTGNVGAGITIPVSPHFVIQAEINVEQKGSGMKVTQAGYDYRYAICDPGPCNFGYFPVDGKLSSRLTYMTLPIMGGYRLGKVTLLAGPYLAYKLDESVAGTFTSQYLATTNTIVSTGNRYNNIDWGISAGATYVVTRFVSLDLRYNQGFIYAASPYPIGYTTYTEPFYNQSAQLGVRYALLR